jgi:SAM-dependent methyltransferase
MTAGAATALIDVPGTDWLARLGIDGAPLVVQPATPIRLPVEDASLDAVVALWTGFRGVDADELREADRALRPGGRLLVVHDYGRDDVSLLRDPDAPEYVTWSRREGPFLRDGGFKIRVVHCFWTFPTLEEARDAVASLGPLGAVQAEILRRPRLSWNVAVYHRARPEMET